MYCIAQLVERCPFKSTSLVQPQVQSYVKKIFQFFMKYYNHFFPKVFFCKLDERNGIRLLTLNLKENKYSIILIVN